MDPEVKRKIVTILRILSKEKEPLGASLISRRLRDFGINLSERAVRYHLKIMDERGLTQGFGKRGRVITKKGLTELRDALVSDKVGLIISKIDALSCRTTLNPEEKRGRIILNISFIPEKDFRAALREMRDIFKTRLCMSDLVAVASGGEVLGDVEIPPGKIGFGTVCSITLNGVLVNAGIPVYSKFGGILQMDDFKPMRFTELITYEGTSLDPLEIFIKGKMTSVREVARTGTGKILASFREIPAVALEAARKMIEELEEINLHGVLAVGEPSQPVLEMSVGVDRVGMVVVGGLNPLAALEEVGIETQSKAMSTMIDFGELKSFWEL
ncbi:MAG: NrpR regulatory domain-containing protein [Actinomycetota bacterium]